MEMSLQLNSDKTKNPKNYLFRTITLDEAKKLKYGDTLRIQLSNGKVGNVRVGSQVKRWKRDPNRIEITFKYGLYESRRFTTEEILRDILVPI